MAKRVLITGAAGTIGTILRRNLKEYEITPVDIVAHLDSPNYREIDVVHDYEELRNAMKGQDAVIHLAWDSRESASTDIIVPENKTMVENICEAAFNTEPRPRVIVASSIHAVYGHIGKKPGLITLEDHHNPTARYGATKCYIEILGKYYAAKNDLQVVAVRLGHVYPRDAEDVKEGQVRSPNYLSHRDCAEIFRHCVESEDLPKYCVLFAVSNNQNRVVDILATSRMLGYEPKDSVEAI